MKSSLEFLPPEYRDEYLDERTPFVRRRAASYMITGTALYAAAASHYAIRQLWGVPGQVYRSQELPVLWFLCAATAVCWAGVRFTKSIAAAKAWACVYTAAFIGALTAYSTIYHEHVFFFSFYYGCSLLLAALLVPWRIREAAGLCAAFAAGYCAYLAILLVRGIPVPAFPRFRPYFDGLVFMGLVSAISLVIRKNDIEHDLSNFLLLKKNEKQRLQMEGELRLADRVHKTLIPASSCSDRASVAVTYIPMHFVGGDCGKFRFLDEDRLLVFISDVTGHGIPAALLVNRVHAEFERLVRDDVSPGRLMKDLNRFIARDFEGTQMYLTGFCGLVDLRRGTLTYSSYGHPAQYAYRPAAGEVVPLDSQATLLGFSEESGIHESEVTFSAGDQLVLFTDGVIETPDAAGEFFGEKRLREFIRANAGLAGEPFNEALVLELKRHGAGRFTDDVFVLNVKTEAAAAPGGVPGGAQLAGGAR